MKGETWRSSYQLAPGEGLEMPFYLQSLFKMTEPGEYTVRVTRKIWPKNDGLIKATSAPLKIKLTPAPEKPEQPAKPDNQREKAASTGK